MKHGSRRAGRAGGPAFAPPLANDADTLRRFGRHLHEALHRPLLQSPPDALLRAFVRGELVVTRDLRADGWDPSVLARLGLADVTGDSLHARAIFEPWDGLVVGRHRLTQGMGEPESADGIGPNARALSRMTPRALGVDVLDLGCGQGFHAMRAARHARRVVATDVSRVALRLAEINAAMNDLPRVEFRRGSLYEPVAGESFDLVIANAPFVFSPLHSVTDAGTIAAGDDFCEALVRGAPAHLRDGGYAVFLLNWEHATPDDWESRPRAWVANAPADAWIVRLRTSTAERVMDAWFASREGPNAANEVGCAEALRRWREHVAEVGVGALSMGMIFLRRREGPTWVRAESHSLSDGDDQAGDQVLRIFENQTLLGQPHGDWLRLRFTPVDTVLAGTHEDGRVLLRQPRGFRNDLAVDVRVLDLLAAFDADRPAADVLAAFAAQAGVDPHRAEAIAAELVRRGYLQIVVPGR